MDIVADSVIYENFLFPVNIHLARYAGLEVSSKFCVEVCPPWGKFCTFHALEIERSSCILCSKFLQVLAPLSVHAF